MARESYEQMVGGLGQAAGAMGQAKGGLWEPGEAARAWEGLKGIGNIAGGAVGYVGSPIFAALRTLGSQPLEDVSGIPREYPEFAAQFLLGPETLRPSAPGVAKPVPLIRPPQEPPRPDVAIAGEELRAAGIPADVPRAITGGRAVQSTAQHLSKVPYAGLPIGEAVHTTLPRQLEAGRDITAAELGAGTGPNVAHRVGNVLSESAAAETKAAEDAAKLANEQATAQWQQAQQQREAQIAQSEQQARQAAQRGVGPEIDPTGMGGVVINRVRNAHDEAAQNRTNLYNDAADREAFIGDHATGTVDRDVRIGLRTAGRDQTPITITPNLTPAANEMMQSIEAFGERARQRRAQAEAEAVDAGGTPRDAERTGQNLRQYETQRRELGGMMAGVRDATDMRAASHVMNQFDQAQEAAMAGPHYEGDPDALAAIRRARAAHRDLMERFGYNGDDAASRTVNKIVRGEADQHIGPVDVSKKLTTPGDEAGPLFTRVMEATGNHPDVQQAVRSGTFSKLTEPAAPGLPPRTPKDIQTSVYKYARGPGRDVANRVFEPQHLDLMQAHADALVRGQAEREAAEAAAKTSKPVPVEAQKGPIQQLADTVLGKGQKPWDAALFDTLYGYAKKGGDYKTLAKVVEQLPQSMRGDLGHTFIRQLGISPGTKEFSLSHFANQWANITPQAKAIMFGMSGPLVRNLDNIATIAKETKLVQSRFGNPSGTTSGNIFGALMGLIGGAVGESVFGAAKTLGTTAATLGGSYVAARFLASPAGASAAAKYMQAVQRANSAPSVRNMAAVNLTKRNVISTAMGLRAGGGLQAAPQGSR
jgi:hypothetical protein